MERADTRRRHTHVCICIVLCQLFEELLLLYYSKATTMISIYKTPDLDCHPASRNSSPISLPGWRSHAARQRQGTNNVPGKLSERTFEKLRVPTVCSLYYVDAKTYRAHLKQRLRCSPPTEQKRSRQTAKWKARARTKKRGG